MNVLVSDQLYPEAAVWNCWKGRSCPPTCAEPCSRTSPGHWGGLGVPQPYWASAQGCSWTVIFFLCPSGLSFLERSSWVPSRVPSATGKGGEDVQLEMQRRTGGNRWGLRSALVNCATALRVVWLIQKNGKFPFNLLGRISMGKKMYLLNTSCEAADGSIPDDTPENHPAGY